MAAQPHASQGAGSTDGLPVSAQGGATRRQFLVGGGIAAAAVLGGGALATRLGPLHRWLTSIEGGGGGGGAGSVKAAGGSVLRGELASRYVKAPVPYALCWPPGTHQGQALPVCFALPGRGGPLPLSFASSVAREVAAHKAAPFVVACIEGGVSYWHPRAGGEDRLAMLLHELVPLCTRKYHLGAGRRRALMGWSMGGYGALLAAETEPATFACVAAAGPAVWTSYQAMMLGPQDAFDNAADFARYDVIAHADRLAHTAVRIDIGRQDPFWGYVTHLAQVLPAGSHVNYSEGGHNEAYWHTLAPAEVRFVAKAIA